MFPGFILSLSLFHFSMVVHRFQTVFDSLTPSVIHRYVSTSIEESLIQFWLDPQIIQNGIQTYFQIHLTDEVTEFTIEFEFFQVDQITRCESQCYGVLTTLRILLKVQPISFSRHYQLVSK
ncbi:MAG: hypothetical protein RLZZ264_300 [Bacillota bacterium]|jgi:hypothetical protein